MIIYLKKKNICFSNTKLATARMAHLPGITQSMPISHKLFQILEVCLFKSVYNENLCC